jgi:hypothetical protein
MLRSASRALGPAAFCLALCVLIFGAAGGPGFGVGSGETVFATRLERSAGAPFYDMLAWLAVRLPAGEPGFRLAVLAAVLGALVLVGVVRAVQAMRPSDPTAPIAGGAAALVLALTPPFRDAAGLASPAILAACGLVWAFACAARHARAPSARRALAALAWCAVVIGAAPWLGAVVTLAIAAWLRKARVLAPALAAIGGVAIVLWIGAIGALPPAAPDLAAVIAASGRGAAAIVVGAGLLGAAFAAITALPSARWLTLVIGLTAAHAITVAHDPTPLLAVLAIGVAVIPSAIVRAAGGGRPHLVALGASLPLVTAALVTGAAFGVDDPGAAPARLAVDLIGELPSGPGIFVATSDPSWFAIQHAHVVAGLRPDLELAPPIDPATIDVEVAKVLRAGWIVGADVPSIGQLDPVRALPRGRGFELLAEPPPAHRAVLLPPAHYASATGAEQAILLAMSRARYEATNSRLDAAARAAGLAGRFGAADLAVLGATVPTMDRPALFGFVPRLGSAEGPWILDLFGDDLAWVAGIQQPDAEAPPERKLHALWRKLWRKQIANDDPEIRALGPAAVHATEELTSKLVHPPGPEPGRP